MTRHLRAATALLTTGASLWTLAVPLARILPAPPLTSPDRWEPWLHATDPATAAFTAIRLAGLGMAGLLVVGLGAVVTAGLADRRAYLAPVRAITRVVPAPVLATAALLVGVGAASAGCARNPAGPAGGSHTSGPPATISITRAGAAAASAPAPAAPSPTTWRVRPGDNLYSIAASVVAARGGDHAAVGRYWLSVLAANPRPDVDMIFPGERVVLPPFPD